MRGSWVIASSEVARDPLELEPVATAAARVGGRACCRTGVRMPVPNWARSTGKDLLFGTT